MADRVHRTAKAIFPNITNSSKFNQRTGGQFVHLTTRITNSLHWANTANTCSLDPDLLMVFTAEPTLHVKVQTELSDAQKTLNK